MTAEIDEAPAAYEPTRLGGISLALWSSLGLVAAFFLSVDKLKMLEDPDFVPSCNFNPVLSCGSVITTDQASAFGFPNPFLGLVGFAVIATLGVLLAAQVVLPRWVLVGAAAGSFLGFGFVHWLAFQSLYTIGALCPWCLVVWAISPLIWLWPTFWAAASSPRSSVRTIGRALWDWRYLAVASWYLLVVVLILIRFWSYWRTLL
ncbi:MAG: vitamin K epoxide reductase family protein [Propionibacteriales bacterium]|nr:vitamin K epoxide reductase family protein [Propionibacteriales bacterium]